jgi:opacity protein-like surface antigen
MMRCAHVAMFVVIGLVAVAARSQAQAPVGTDSSRFYADVTFGATFGHKSSGSIGGEAGFHVTNPLAIFIEGGRMSNVGTEDLDARALRIANAVGATASTSYKVNYFSVGARVAPELYWPVRPYGLFGFGLAQVRAETALAVNGTTVPPESLGVQFGSDLNGTEKKPFITVGGGFLYTFATRYFADVSYRYGRILPKTSVTENDQGINTNRLQVGVGIKF